MKLMDGDLEKILDHYRNMAVVTEDDMNNAVIDKEGFAYSKDGKRLLKGAESLDYVVKDGTEVICNEAFSIGNVKKILFPQSLRYIGDEAFMFSINNEELIIPNSVIYIGKGAFRNICAQCIEIGDSVAYIGNLAFANNYLDEIVIPSSVIELDGNPFGCDIKKITSLSEAFVVKDDILYSKDGKELISCFSMEKELVIPNTVEHIHPFAFFESEVKFVTLPDSVNKIGEAAFARANMKSVILPNGIKTIPTGAFYESQIEKIIIPDSATEVKSDAFCNCRELKEVQMSSNIETIEEYAFAYCMKLESINMPDFLKNIGDKAFFCCHELKRHEDEIGRSINID